MAVQIKRVYEPAEANDGKRILIDRLWPRGVSKEKAKLDGWMKELAPSAELRRWFGHEPERFAEFSGRYRQELQDPARQPQLEELLGLAKQGRVTLLYAAKNAQFNQAVVLQAYLRERLEATAF